MVDSINSTGRACLLHGPQLGRGVQRQGLWGSSEGLAVERSPRGVGVGPAWTSVPGVQEVGPPAHLTVLLVQVVTPHSPSYPSSHPLAQDRDPRECSHPGLTQGELW